MPQSCQLQVKKGPTKQICGTYQVKTFCFVPHPSIHRTSGRRIRAFMQSSHFPQTCQLSTRWSPGTKAPGRPFYWTRRTSEASPRLSLRRQTGGFWPQARHPATTSGRLRLPLVSGQFPSWQEAGQKSVGAPPSALRRATKSASSSRIAASIGGSSNAPMISLNILCARSAVQVAPAASQAS